MVRGTLVFKVYLHPEALRSLKRGNGYRYWFTNQTVTGMERIYGDRDESITCGRSSALLCAQKTRLLSWEQLLTTNCAVAGFTSH